MNLNILKSKFGGVQEGELEDWIVQMEDCGSADLKHHAVVSETSIIGSGVSPGRVLDGLGCRRIFNLAKIRAIVP